MIEGKFKIGEYAKVLTTKTIGKIVEVWENKREGNRIFYKFDNDDRWQLESNLMKLS